MLLIQIKAYNEDLDRENNAGDHFQFEMVTPERFEGYVTSWFVVISEEI